MQNDMNDIEIRTEDLELKLITKLEDMVFNNHRTTKNKLANIQGKRALFLVAYQDAKPVGFKLGYVPSDKQAFFSWLGGVHTDYRRQGIAESLLLEQEHRVAEMGLKTIYFTTFDRFPAMIKLGEKNGYACTKSIIDGSELKYWYEKQLK